VAEHVASFMCCTNSVNSALAPISLKSVPFTASKPIPASQHEQEVTDWIACVDHPQGCRQFARQRRSSGRSGSPHVSLPD
jgi:hypothetical protein